MGMRIMNKTPGDARFFYSRHSDESRNLVVFKRARRDPGLDHPKNAFAFFGARAPG